MIKVECVSCKAPYELDERRIPEKGMKMRCPKCGTSFNVTRSGVASGAAPSQAIAPPIAAPAPIAAPPPAAAPPAAAIATPFGGGGAIPKGTMLGHQAPAPIAPPAAAPAPAAAPKPARPPMGTMVGIAPPGLEGAKAPAGALTGSPQGQAPIATPFSAAKGAFGSGAAKPAAPAAPAPASPAPAKSSVFDETDLPAPRAAQPKPVLPSIDMSDLSVSNIRVDQLPMPKREVDLPRPQNSMSPPSAFDADLPAPKQNVDLPAAKPPKGTMLGAAPIAPAPIAAPFADLPAVKQNANADLPAPKQPAPLSFGDLDLPAPKQAMNVDLPAPKQAKQAGVIDLPTPKQAGVIDLPTPKQAGVMDLPTPKQAGAIDLPAPKHSVDLPAPRGSGVDLPAPRGGGVDLPAAKGQMDLPSPRSGGARFGEIDLPTPKAGAVDLPAPANDLPAPRGDDSSFADLMLDLPDFDAKKKPDDAFGDIELPPPKPAADMIASRERTIQGPARRAPTMQQQAAAQPQNSPDSELPPSLLGGDESSFGDLNMEEDDGLSLSDPPAPRSSASGAKRAAPMQQASAPPAHGGGYEDDLLGDEIVDEEEEYEEGDDFGEEDFVEGEGEEGDDEEMEFGISGDEEGRASLAPDALRRQRGEDFEARQAASRKRTVTIIVRLAALLVLLTAGSAALAFTEYGIFGIYYWEKWLPEAGDPEFARSAIQKAEKIGATDTYADVQRSLKELGAARAKAGINRQLLTRGVLHESLSIVRFGEDPAAAARAVAILKRLEERSGRAPEMDLARAADAARRKAWTDAEGKLAAARSQGPRDPYVELLAGEVALAQGKTDEADKAFAQALKLGGGARAQWGLARVAITRDDKEAQTSAVNETLKLSPMHVDARIAEARIVWAQGKEERGLHLLQVALGREPTEEDKYLWSSKTSAATGYSVLGYMHEARGRLRQAWDAYEMALKADALRVEALLGSGRVLIRQDRANDALPRFESALKSASKGGANPIVLSGRHADAEAKLGIGRVLLALDRAAEAKAQLLQLSQSLPQDAEVALTLGETEEKLNNMDNAEAQLRKSITLAPTRFDGYLALSQLFSRQNNPAKASEVLNEAANHVEENAHMRRMLGQSELARGKLDGAAHEFKRALELDPYDTEAKFGLGVALRKSGDLEAAEAAFDDIAKRDSSFSGLAEQRGLLLEARGKYPEAIAVYRGALEKDQNNMSLVLRLGAAQVLANQLDDAEQTLAKVIREIPNSAEAEYFIGRVSFARGRTADALAHFDRAIGLDISKAEYHLYVARSTWELGNFSRTMEEADAAIKRDPFLGDAFWVRAMVRLRVGQVKDSLKDLEKALKYNPARTDAYAVRGDCYEQLRQLPDAIASYRQALQIDDTRGQWWYRLAGLLADSGDHAQADAALKRAIDAGEKTEPFPHWLPDAYRLAGEGAERKNDRQSAIRNYKRYLEISQTNAIDYAPVTKKLRGWGVELGEEE
jgi:predicted Zn finger-like uncharacterized protein